MKQAAPKPKRPKGGKRHAPSAADGGQVLVWYAADYHDNNDHARSTATLLFGYGVVAPVAGLFLLVNMAMFFVSLIRGESPHWRLPDDDMLWSAALCIVVMGVMFYSMTGKYTEVSNVSAYEIDLRTGQLTLHQSQSHNRVDVVTIPFSAIVSITPYLPTIYADTGGFCFSYYANGTEAVYWETRDSMSKKTMQAHADALRSALGSRVRDQICYDR
ncbi:hypothetical protein [Massilia aquatica]|uniref:PH domain-containing protein n=1 Tax=Massilia aquatica TaxID=2609000 RepID=A0ABX0LZM2_9BURK|nr:hypothetical protein [Massilia aquatica]NHZ39878.1 hypothetical protein [Massilia aquatica]